jgi:hypothetical protein
MSIDSTPTSIEVWSLQNSFLPVRKYKIDSIQYNSSGQPISHITYDWTGTQFIPKVKCKKLNWGLGFNDLFQFVTSRQYQDYFGYQFPEMNQWIGYTNAEQQSWNGSQWNDSSKTIEKSMNGVVNAICTASVDASNVSQWDTLISNLLWFNGTSQMIGYKSGYAVNGFISYTDSSSCLYASNSNRIIEKRIFNASTGSWQMTQGRSFRWHFDNNQRLLSIAETDLVSQLSEDSMVLIYSTSTSVNEPTANINFDVYPNPSNDYLFVYVNSPVSNAQIEIMDMQGRMIRRENANYFPWKVSVEGLNNGFYAVKLIHSSGESSKKLIISR